MSKITQETSSNNSASRPMPELVPIKSDDSTEYNEELKQMPELVPLSGNSSIESAEPNSVPSFLADKKPKRWQALLQVAEIARNNIK